MKKISIFGLALFIFGAGCSTESGVEKKSEPPKNLPEKAIEKKKINSSPFPPKGVKRPLAEKK